MQVTKRQEANYRRETEETQEVGGGTEGWHVLWSVGAGGSGSFINRLLEKKNPAQSSPAPSIQLPSLPGLVEEDVSRLGVLRDV